MPYFLLGDDAFALKTWLMKPYPLKGKGKTYQIAKYRISRGRRVVENAFGILSQRFRVLSNTIQVHPDRVRVIVLACVVLHNMLRGERGAGGARDVEDEEIPCDMDPAGDGPGPDRNPGKSAKEQRDYLEDWFNGAGAVPWQDARA